MINDLQTGTDDLHSVQQNHTDQDGQKLHTDVDFSKLESDLRTITNTDQTLDETTSSRIFSLIWFYFFTAIGAFLFHNAYQGDLDYLDDYMGGFKHRVTTQTAGGAFFLMAALLLFVSWLLNSKLKGVLGNQVLKKAQLNQVLKYVRIAFSSLGGCLIFTSYCFQMKLYEDADPPHVIAQMFFQGFFYLLTIGMGFLAWEYVNVFSICAWASFAISMMLGFWYVWTDHVCMSFTFNFEH